MLALDLFAGGGGASLGLKAAGFETIGVESDSAIADIHKANVGECFNKGVENVEVRSFPKPDLIWASPPCQQWSMARSSMLPPRDDGDIGYAIIPYIEALQPRWFVLENVVGYRKSKVFHAIVGCLFKHGYWAHWDIYDAADFGVPQNRRRLILRAVRGGHLPSMPLPRKWVGWYEAVENIIHSFEESSFVPWQLRKIGELSTSALVQSGNTQGSDKPFRCPDQPSPTVVASKANLPRAFLVERVGCRSDGSIVIRRQNEPCWTLRASYGNDDRKDVINSWLDSGRVVSISPRGLARFQSFPDSYELPSKASLACKIIGNSVPPLMSKVIAESVVR